ncbi:MAG: response regulator transcription factor [Chloroflexia bacterium]|nr:response regulator transcription factor [Chloroflexia bacterium]
MTNTFTDPVKALKKLPHINPDLVFLDINMPGLNGFQLLEKLENFNFNVIFTTAYDEYAIKAFKFGAANYLLKPIDIDDLIAAVKRIMSKNNKENIEKTLSHVGTDIDNRISITSIDGVHFLKPEEIIYIVAEGTQTNVVLKTGKIIIVKNRLKTLKVDCQKTFSEYTTLTLSILYM